MPSSLPKVLVTGTSSGIGLAIAEHLLTHGHKVVGLDANPSKIKSENFEPITIDLLQQTDVAALLENHTDAQSLVHAAGVLRVAQIGKLSEVDFDSMWRLNVSSVSVMVNLLAPHMAQRGRGRVVLIGSRVAQGMPGRSQYAATKSALVGLARSWAAELIVQGVTVNIVSPSATQTAMLTDPARSGSAPKLPPIGRLIQPSEIASLVAYLLSTAADAITGQDIQICGGASLPR